MTDINAQSGATGKPSAEIAAPESGIMLIPASSIAGRALVTVIAIMTFLATLTAGAAMLVRDSSRNWSTQITQEMTIQIKPQAGRNIDTDVETAAGIAKGFPGIESVRTFSRKESQNLLEPWLGSGVSMDDLPVPRLIVIKPAASKPDLAELQKKLKSAVPQASLDDHRLWFERLNSMANALVLVALIIMLLVISAMAFAIGFATRGAMAGTRDIIDVLHFVGANDSFISRQFQRHFFILGLKGAVIGGWGTMAAFLMGALLMQVWSSGPGSEQVESLFGTFALGWQGFVLIALMTLAIAILVGNISRTIVFRHLQTLR